MMKKAGVDVSEMFDRRILTGEISMKYARGMRDIFGKEIHRYHELFFFLGGEADFIFENGRVRLEPYSLVVIPRETFHQFVVLGEEKDYIRCVLSFEEVTQLERLIRRKITRIMVVREEKIKNLFLKLTDLTEYAGEREEREILLKSYFAQILVFLKEQKGDSTASEGFHAVTVKVLELLNADIAADWTMGEIARRLHVSESYLAHVFKKDLHISVYRYLLEKRLILANGMICRGAAPTQVAAKCGFGDYSGFYRQYRKMFGTAPSGTKDRLSDNCATEKALVGSDGRL